jgi:hypothetical protein
VLDPLADHRLGQVQLSGDLATILPVVRISSTTSASALYSGGKNRRGHGTWSPILRVGPPSWVSTKPGQLHTPPAEPVTSAA